VTRRDLDPDELAALEDQRDFLLRSLEDLEREHAAGDVDEVDYASLKDDYTARAAAVIKTIDERRAAHAATRPQRRWGVTVAVGAVVVLIGISAGWLVAASSGQREPGDTITGGIRESTIDELAKAADYTAQATDAQQRGDSDAAVSAYQSALGSYSAVLDQQPDNAEALTYRGWLLHVLALQASEKVAAELEAEALDSINRAVVAAPTFADARIFRAIILERAGQYTDAAADLAAIDPAAVPPGMADMVDTLRARVEAASG
jgi:tetratricopeptide (TPR) repeat protein